MILKPAQPKLNRNHVLAKNLRGAWLMTDRNGAKVQDFSGRGHHGSMNQTYTGWSLNSTGPVTTYTGSDSQSEVNTTDTIVDLSPPTITVMAVATPSVITSNRCLAVKYGDNFNPGADSWILRCDGGYPLFAAHMAGNWRYITSVTHQLTVGRRHIIGGTYDGQTIRVYLDGQIVATTPYAGAVETSTSLLRIGRAGYMVAGERWGGTIESVQVWAGALSPETMLRLVADPYPHFRPTPPVLPSTISGQPYRRRLGGVPHTGGDRPLFGRSW
jgi:hypothetical protein